MKFHHNLRIIPYLHYWYLAAQKGNFTTIYGTFHIFTTGIYQLRKEISPQPTDHSISSLLVFTSSERKFHHNLRNIPYLHYWYLPAQKRNFTTTYGTFQIYTTGIYQLRKEISPQPTEHSISSLLVFTSSERKFHHNLRNIPYLHYWYLPAQKGNFTTTYGTFHIFTTGIYQLRKEISPQPTEHSISSLLVFTSSERKFHHNLRNIPYLHYWYLPAQKRNFTTTYGTFHIFTTGIYQLRKEISPQPTEHSISSLLVFTSSERKFHHNLRNIPYLHYWYLPAQKGNFTTTYGTFHIFTTGIYQLRKEISPQPTEHSISTLLVFTSPERKFHHNLRNIPYLHYWYLPAQKGNFATTYGTFHIFTTGIYQLRKEISPQPTEHSISSLLVFTSPERKFHHNLRNIPYLHYWYLPAQKGNFTTTYGTFHIFTTGIYQLRKEISPQPTEHSISSLLVFTSSEKKFHHNLRNIPYLHYWYLPAQKGNFTTTYGTFHIYTTGIYQPRKEISPQPTEHSISSLLVFTSSERKFRHNLRNIPYLHYWYLPAQKGNFTTTYGTYSISTLLVFTSPERKFHHNLRNIPYLH